MSGHCVSHHIEFFLVKPKVRKRHINQQLQLGTSVGLEIGSAYAVTCKAHIITTASRRTGDQAHFFIPKVAMLNLADAAPKLGALEKKERKVGQSRLGNFDNHTQTDFVYTLNPYIDGDPCRLPSTIADCRENVFREDSFETTLFNRPCERKTRILAQLVPFQRGGRNFDPLSPRFGHLTCI